MNEIIFVVMLVISLISIFGMYKIFSKNGLYYILILFELLSLITSFKIVKIFSFNLNINIIFIISTMTIIYILLTKYSNKESKNILSLSLITILSGVVLLTILSYYIPSLNEIIAINIKSTFIYNYKILIFLPLTILLGTYLTIKLYTFINTLQSNIYINILLVYIITGLLYTILFNVLGYLKIIDIYNSTFIGLTTYLFGIIITIIQFSIINLILSIKEVKQ